jgi:hypothetical protein
MIRITDYMGTGVIPDTKFIARVFIPDEFDAHRRTGPHVMLQPERAPWVEYHAPITLEWTEEEPIK